MLNDSKPSALKQHAWPLNNFRIWLPFLLPKCKEGYAQQGRLQSASSRPTPPYPGSSIYEVLTLAIGLARL